MKKIIATLLLCMPLLCTAQNTNDDKVAALQAEAAAKAKAAQEAALAAQEAARQAQEAAEAAARAAQQQSTWTAPVEQKTETVAVEVEKKNTEKEASLEAIAPYLAEDAVPVVDGKVRWTKDIDVPGMSAQAIYDNMLGFLTAMTKEDNQLERSKVALLNASEHKIVATFQEWIVFTSSILSLDRTQFNYVILAECNDGHLKVTLDRISYSYPTQQGFENYQAEKWITDKYSVNKKRTRLLPISGKFRRKTIDRKDQIFENIEKNLK